MEDPVKHWIVYMYTFPNGKKYIGKTCRKLTARQGENFKGYQRCTLLWNAIQKYGVDSIQQDILFEDDCIAKVASEVEMKYIEEYKTNTNKYSNPTYGYNLTSGGDGLTDWHPSPERYEQLCKQLKASHEKFLERGYSAESRLKMSLAKKGKKKGPLPDEVKRKLSIANSRENLSLETRQKRSEMKKKKVLVINTTTGEETIYNSVSEAADKFGVNLSRISRWLTKTRTPPKELRHYKFKYYIPPTTTEREDYVDA